MDFEPGSFRDRQARVFYDGGRILRGLSPHALEQWKALAATRFFRAGVEAGTIVGTRMAEGVAVPGWAAVLEHERVPFVSYPYEWCFSMLRDAALLQLDLTAKALAEGMILKDATPYNTQWRGASPQFIDIASFERLAPGDPWPGYRQFCQLFLYPLLLQAHRGVPFQPWLRGSLEGMEARDCRNLLRRRDLLRRGVFTHVWLQSMVQERGTGEARDVRGELKKAGFRSELIAANVNGLRRMVEGLSWTSPASAWSEYAGSKPYDVGEGAAKDAFVRSALERRRPHLVLDLGCNTGEYSRMAAEHADTVVALDSDPLSIERLYQSERGTTRILPLIGNLADPSPNLGWRGRERRDLAARGRPDLTLCLALVHHLVLGANIPLDELVDWLADLGGDLVIEFVSKEDPMARGLLRNKADIYADYDRAHFEACLARRYTVEEREEIGGGRRVLYRAVARP